jgi:hypothetical protein
MMHVCGIAAMDEEYEGKKSPRGKQSQKMKMTMTAQKRKRKAM